MIQAAQKWQNRPMERQYLIVWMDGIMFKVRDGGKVINKIEDILITCTDNLNGFTDTILIVFPKAATQVCVVHQIRNSCRYITDKDLKAFTVDIKTI